VEKEKIFFEKKFYEQKTHGREDFCGRLKSTLMKKVERCSNRELD
jgi:hypothetical protein